MRLFLALFVGSALTSSVCVQSSFAQPARLTAVQVGQITSAQECTVYEGVKYNNSERSSGSSRAFASASGRSYAGAYSGGGSSSLAVRGNSSYVSSSQTSFETFFFKDCTSQFNGMRDAIQAALASSGTIAVGSGGYVLTGRVEGAVPTRRGFAERSATGNVYGALSRGLRVTMSVNIADAEGKIVFGSPVVAELETDSVSALRGTAAFNLSSGEEQYSFIQRQLALTSARKVAFHFAPLTVAQGGGRKIQLNYGGALLEVGGILTVTSPDGFSAARYRITSVSERSALAEQVGDANSSAIVTGSRATFIEKSDPAATVRLYEKVDLP